MDKVLLQPVPLQNTHADMYEFASCVLGNRPSTWTRKACGRGEHVLSYSSLCMYIIHRTQARKESRSPNQQLALFFQSEQLRATTEKSCHHRWEEWASCLKPGGNSLIIALKKAAW